MARGAQGQRVFAGINAIPAGYVAPGSAVSGSGLAAGMPGGLKLVLVSPLGNQFGFGGPLGQLSIGNILGAGMAGYMGYGLGVDIFGGGHGTGSRVGGVLGGGGRCHDWLGPGWPSRLYNRGWARVLPGWGCWLTVQANRAGLASRSGAWSHTCKRCWAKCLGRKINVPRKKTQKYLPGGQADFADYRDALEALGIGYTLQAKDGGIGTVKRYANMTQAGSLREGLSQNEARRGVMGLAEAQRIHPDRGDREYQ